MEKTVYHDRVSIVVSHGGNVAEVTDRDLVSVFALPDEIMIETIDYDGEAGFILGNVFHCAFDGKIRIRIEKAE